jgi:hypothetical protein
MAGLPRPDCAGKSLTVLVTNGSDRDIWIRCDTKDLRCYLERDGEHSEIVDFGELWQEHPLAARLLMTQLIHFST